MMEGEGEVLYGDQSWDVSRDRRGDKYPTFDGLVQSYSPMTYSEINAEDPNGYNDLLHSSIQGPFSVDTEIVHDERTLSTEKKQDENILIDGVSYPAKVYQIKEMIGFQGVDKVVYHEERTRILWVNQALGLLKWTEKDILYSEFYGLGDSSNPHIDEFFTYTLVTENNPNQPVDTVSPELELFGGTAIIHKLGEPWVEPGFDASDERDGNLTSSVTISGSVDIDTAGTYVLTYSVSDTSGNVATVTRTVQVRNELIEFNSANLLTIAENKPVGTLVGEFMGTHEGGNAVFFQLVGGVGDVDNALFNLTDEGLLTNAEVFDFEEAETRSIRGSNGLSGHLGIQTIYRIDRG